MDFNEYRIRGKEMVDFIADYLQNIRDRPVFPNVTPGYMRHLVPDSAPMEGERWQDIYKDIERVIMPGVTHWQSPHMHAYFPALNSFPSLLGDMLADAIGCLGFTWAYVANLSERNRHAATNQIEKRLFIVAKNSNEGTASSPACTELETIVMDWLGKMIGLPSEFYHSNTETMGGGVIQTTASEATFVALLAARSETIKKYRTMDSELSDSEINARLVGYCSDQAHSSVEKAGLIGLVKMRLLPSDNDLSLRGETLKQAIEMDKDEGLIPFYLCATLGTTGACAFDNLKELGPICVEEEIWMHIDAAYAGSAFICDEFRCFMDGVECAQSFAFNPSKWLMVHFDCTAMWVKDSRALHRTFNVQPLYLRHENTGTAIDFMHWQVPLSKRFRALKLWFVLRSFGVKGLQNHIRKGVKMAESFENLVRLDDRFEVAAKRHLGMVVFRLKGNNARTESLLRRLNSSGKVHMVPASLKGHYVIRFTVTSQYTRPEDIIRDWTIIRRTADEVLAEETNGEVTALEQAEDEGEEIEDSLRRKRERLRRKDFGLSLILSNVPMSPKFINGSFAALFDNDNDIITEYTEHVSRSSIDLNGCPIRMSPRKRMENQKRQCSFDHCLLPLPPPLEAQLPIVGAALVHHGGGGDKVRPYQGTVKQGSLDSKIEEIFQKPGINHRTMPDIKDDVEDNESTAADRNVSGSQNEDGGTPGSAAGKRGGGGAGGGRGAEGAEGAEGGDERRGKEGNGERVKARN